MGEGHATDEEVFDAFPSVLINRDNIEHYRGLLAGKLLMNRCQDCGHWIYPHRPICPQCLPWDENPNILRLNGGRTLVMTHGGALAQGRAGGFNFYTEAARQLRGTEGARQAPGAKTALACAGSFFRHPSAVILRAD